MSFGQKEVQERQGKKKKEERQWGERPLIPLQGKCRKFLKVSLGAVRAMGLEEFKAAHEDFK